MNPVISYHERILLRKLFRGMINTWGRLNKEEARATNPESRTKMHTRRQQILIFLIYEFDLRTRINDF